MNKKNKEARQKFDVCIGIDELDQIVAENWPMWKNGSPRYRIKTKNETQRMNKKTKEARQKFDAGVQALMIELGQIVAENLQLWKMELTRSLNYRIKEKMRHRE